MRDDTQTRTTRRRALKRLAAATALTSLAGCTSGSDGDQAGADGTTTAASTTTAPSTDTPTEVATESPTTTTTAVARTETGVPQRGDYTVGMYTGLYFDPVGLYVEPGETVSFELVSGAHSATAYDSANENALNRRVPADAPAWDTGTFGDVGAFRNVTLETEGTHDYYCIPHKMVGMVGRIVVGSPGGPAEESENPDLPLPDSTRIVDDGAVAWEDWEENV